MGARERGLLYLSPGFSIHLAADARTVSGLASLAEAWTRCKKRGRAGRPWMSRWSEMRREGRIVENRNGKMELE